MKVQPDFKELLRLLNENAVEYVVVGAYAVAWHGAPRFTGDLDIYVRPDQHNATRVMKTLEQFGFGSVGLTEEDFRQVGRVVQLGFPPVRIDLITSISGVEWDDTWRNRVSGGFDDLTVTYLGKEQLVANKRAAGRLKDLADLEALGEIVAPPPNPPETK